MRLFIAANIPEKIKEEFVLLNKGLKYKIPKVSWITGRNFHITLKFLGEVQEGRIPKIISSVSDICKEIKPFTVKFSGLGAFPDLKYPHIIWAGVSEGKSELENLAKKIEYSLEKIGFEKERRSFSAHLTIGRVRSPKVRDLSFENIQAAFSPFELKNIDLMQSVLKPSGAEHTILETFIFGGKG